MAKTNSFINRTVFSLAAIFSFRLLGLFIILPVFALHAEDYKYVTPTLIGIALGIYGLTQAILQLPLGILSDRVGRKPIIITGLVVFIIGSVICALATNIYGVIIGRALQGAGAVGSTILALLADSTTLEQRTKAMAFIGMSIGLSFLIAMVIGPFLDTHIGLSGLFWLTAILGCLGILILLFGTSGTPCTVFHRDTEPVPALLLSILRNKQLLCLDLSILFLHALLTASFIAIPVALAKSALISSQQQWLLYLPVLLLAFLASLPFIIVSEKRGQIKPTLIIAILLIALTQLAFIKWQTSIIIAAILLFIFFTAFTLLEATLPSLVSKLAPAGSKGTAIGIFSSAQFLGIFIGGSLGGWISNYYGLSGIFIFCSAISFIWLLIIICMKKPLNLSTLMLEISINTNEQALDLSQRLQKIKGVAEAVIVINEKTAYLKVDKNIVDKNELQRVINLM